MPTTTAGANGEVTIANGGCASVSLGSPAVTIVGSGSSQVHRINIVHNDCRQNEGDFFTGYLQVGDSPPSPAPPPRTDPFVVTPTTADPTVTITAAANAAPVCTTPWPLTNEDAPLNGTLVCTDTDGNTLTYGRVANASNGNAVVNANGSFTYTPNLNFFGTDSFTFKANDGTVDSNTATFTVTVTAVNDAPTLNAIPDPAAILEDAGAQTVNLSGISAGGGESARR